MLIQYRYSFRVEVKRVTVENVELLERHFELLLFYLHCESYNNHVVYVTIPFSFKM